MGVLDVTCPECDGVGGACTFCEGDGAVALTGDTYSKGVTTGNLADVINAAYAALMDALDTKMDALDTKMDVIEAKIDALEQTKGWGVKASPLAKEKTNA